MMTTDNILAQREEAARERIEREREEAFERNPYAVMTVFFSQVLLRAAIKRLRSAQKYGGLDDENYKVILPPDRLSNIIDSFAQVLETCKDKQGGKYLANILQDLHLTNKEQYAICREMHYLYYAYVDFLSKKK